MTDARDELAKRIVEIAKASLARYAEEFPERIDEDNTDYPPWWVYRVVERVVKALDDYEITAKKPKKAAE